MKHRNKYPRPPITLEDLFKLKEGHRVSTRYLGPGIVITAAEKDVKPKVRVQLLRPLWENRIEEFNHRELTPFDNEMI